MATAQFQTYISARTGGPQSVVVSLKIDGLNELLTKTDQYRQDGPRAMGRAMYAEALLIMLEAKKLTPVRFGFLRASGFVKTPEMQGQGVSLEMGFGGAAGTGNQGESNSKDVGYALAVHENVAAFHHVGQAKFLEQPVLASISGMESRLAVRVKADLHL